MDKEIIYIGLGKMGFNMCQNLLDHDWTVHAYNRTFAKAQELAQNENAFAYENIEDLFSGDIKVDIVWIMVPHNVVDEVIALITPFLRESNIVIDGGNSPYKESIRRHEDFAAKGFSYLDVGVSGGPKGAREGACTMIGGKKELFEQNEDLFKDISAPDAYGYMGKAGSGHLVKMVHNGIEYGMMQSIAEGFDIMQKSKFDLDLTEISRVYNNASVIESSLVGWMNNAFKEYGNDLEGISNKAIGTGEGKWTIELAEELGLPSKVISEAFKAREYSGENPNFQAQIIMALRNQFGGHAK